MRYLAYKYVADIEVLRSFCFLWPLRSSIHYCCCFHYSETETMQPRFILFLIISAAFTSAQLQCNGNCKRNVKRDKCYCVIDQRVDFYAAQTDCETLAPPTQTNLYASLTSIHNQMQNDEITSNLYIWFYSIDIWEKMLGRVSVLNNNCTRYWIGLMQLMKGMDWMWTDFSKFDYTNWDIGNMFSPLFY